MPELATSVLTPGCSNPWARDREPGGSSGGSAAAVADGIVPVALGSDTGGSIRIPAALCGVAGLRPTQGLVSRHGVTLLVPSMDTIGPIARTAAECLTVHTVLSGQMLEAADVEGLRVGAPRNLWVGRVAPEVAGAQRDAERGLADAGVEIVDVELPLAARYARYVLHLIFHTELAMLWLAELAAHPTGVGPGVAEDIAIGTDIPAVHYARAQQVRRSITAELDDVLRDRRLVALVLPTVPVVAQPSGATEAVIDDRAVPIAAAYSQLSALASVTGHPALSVPSGLSAEGLPIGAQLIGPRLGEAMLCRLGGVIESTPGGRAVAEARAKLGQ